MLEHRMAIELLDKISSQEIQIQVLFEVRSASTYAEISGELYVRR